MPISIDGKEYKNSKGEVIKLYPISKLSQALTDAGYPRDTQILRKWERWGTVPPAVFHTGVKKKKRLYSEEQINMFVAVAEYCDIKQGKSVKKFSELIWINLGELNNEIVGEKNNG